MDGLIAQAYTPYDVPHLSSGGNGNLSPNPYHTRLEPDDYQSGAFSTVIGDYETPDADHEDFSEFINFDSEEQAVDNPFNDATRSAVVAKDRLLIVTNEGSSKLSIFTNCQLLSPELTNNPTPTSAHRDDSSLANPTNSLGISSNNRTSCLPSPNVKINDCKGDETPTVEERSRSLSIVEHMGVFFPSHVSPITQDPWTLNEIVDEVYHQTPQISWQMPTVQRNPDGSWLRRTANGPSGFDPESRAQLGDRAMPTLAEQEERRQLAARESEVQQWLSHSQTTGNAGSDAGNSSSSAGREAPSGRPRAKSPGEVTVRQGAPADFVSPKTHGHDLSIVPGPSVVIDEVSSGEADSDLSSDDEATISAAVAALERYRINEEVKAQVSPPQVHGDIELSFNTRVWGDPLIQPTTSESRYQPDTSMAAIRRFYQRSKEIETASRTATIGSSYRRLSESDLDSIYEKATKPKRFSIGKDKDKTKQNTGRSPSVLDNILGRTSSNTLKAKSSHPAQASLEAGMTKTVSQHDPNNFGAIRSNGPLVYRGAATNIAPAPRERGFASAIPTLAQTSPFVQITNALRRSRSRSDMIKPQGLAALMTQHGGPPVPTLATRSTAAEQNTHFEPYPQSGVDNRNGAAEDDGVAEQSVNRDLTTQVKPNSTSLGAFRLLVRQHGPRLPPILVERLAQEQMSRYKRLADAKIKHLTAVRLGNCTDLCTSLGASPRILPLSSSKKGPESCLVGYRIESDAFTGQKLDSADETTLEPARFPLGIPLPPVEQLPAEFECTLCFQIKRVMKPSDWTKHVLEDIQPFTCSFSPCKDPKSFKRKADWVRHENESHRHLESWVCFKPKCEDMRHRKENFIQHLARVHKIFLPEDGTGKISVAALNGEADFDDNQEEPKSGLSDSPEVTSDATQSRTVDIARLLRTCHRESTQSPQNEPCRFCGEVLASWKDLTVHLAKHMEQISMSVLHLINDDRVMEEKVVDPVAEVQKENKRQMQMQGENITVAMPLPQRIDDARQIADAAPSWQSPINSGYDNLQSTNISSAAARTMHNYPPPHLDSYNMLAPAQSFLTMANSSPSAGNSQRVLGATCNWPVPLSFRQELSGFQAYPIAPSGSGQSYSQPQMGQIHSTSPNSQSYPPVGINHIQRRANNNQGWGPSQQATQPGLSPLMVTPPVRFSEPQVYLSPTDTIHQDYGLDSGCLVPDGAFPYAHQEDFSQYVHVQGNQIPVHSHLAQSYSYPPQLSRDM